MTTPCTSAVTSVVNDEDITTTTRSPLTPPSSSSYSSSFCSSRLLASSVSAFAQPQQQRHVHSNKGTSKPFVSSLLNPVVNDEDHFPQGCQFSPDGLCVLTAQCHRLLLYNTPVAPPCELITSSTHSDNEDPGTATRKPDADVEITNTTACSWDPVLDIEAGDKVRSYAWYPHMNSNNAATCCFVATSRDQPVHLYDAYTGTIRASYRPYNGLDEMESPAVVSFCHGGQHLVTGGFRTNRMVQIFDVSRPGRDPLQTLQLGKTRRSKDGQKGLVSAIASGSINTISSVTAGATTTSNYHNLLAVGTYAPGSIYLYDERCYLGADEGATITISGNCIVGHGRSHGRKSKKKRKHSHVSPSTTTKEVEEEVGNGNNPNHNIDHDRELDMFSLAKVKWFQSRARGGITQLEFSHHDHLLYSASRRSNAILAWDLRRLSTLSNHCPGVASFETNNDTNQRLEFAIHHPSRIGGGSGSLASHQLWIGGRDGCVRVYDCQSQKLVGTFVRGEGNGLGCADAVNGISLTNPSSNKKAFLAMAVGSRHFPSEHDWSSSDESDDKDDKGIGNGTKTARSHSVVQPGSLQVYEVDTSTRT